MFVFLKNVSFLFLITLANLPYAAQEQVEITVNGLHNDKTRIVENNSVLFSGDSFQLEIKVDSNQYVYSFLLDSSGVVTKLDAGFKTNQKLITLPSKDEWFRLDNNPGQETLVVVGSNKPLSIFDLTNAIKQKDWESKVFHDAVVKKSNIKHMDVEAITRGFKISVVQLVAGIATDYALDVIGPAILSRLPKNDTPVGKVINKLVNYSNSLTEQTRGVKEIHVFKKASPAVVKIFTRNGVGSGSLISKEGLILTNWHVVGDIKKVGVVFMPEKRSKLTKDDFLKGDVIKINGVVDLALIKLKKKISGRIPLSISNDEPTVGQDAHAIGHPKGGADWTYTKGYISQLNYDDKWSYDETIHNVDLMIQTQTPINPGNSGGPLLNNDGDIIGVNSASSPKYANANYAISAEDIRAFIKQKGNISTNPRFNENYEIKHKYKRDEKKKELAKGKHKKLSEKLGANIVSVEIVDFKKNGSRDHKISVDDDMNGKIETTIIYFEDKKKARVIIYDDDEDGKWDEMQMDEDNNGKVDTILYSKDDGDGIGVVGYDDDEDGTVDRYEDYK